MADMRPTPDGPEKGYTARPEARQWSSLTTRQRRLKLDDSVNEGPGPLFLVQNQIRIDCCRPEDAVLDLKSMREWVSALEVGLSRANESLSARFTGSSHAAEATKLEDPEKRRKSETWGDTDEGRHVGGGRATRRVMSKERKDG